MARPWRSAIAGITASGDTYIAPALTLAAADLDAHVHADSHRIVVLLSDGRNFDNDDYPDSQAGICPESQERRQNTVNAIPALHDEADAVYTIGLGQQTGPPESCDGSELDEELLQEIAESPEYYTHVQQASDLPDIYAHISEEVTDLSANLSGHRCDDLGYDGGELNGTLASGSPAGGNTDRLPWAAASVATGLMLGLPLARVLPGRKRR